MRDNGSEWMLWKQNPPSASNMAGVSESQIRSAKTIHLDFFLWKTHDTSLKDESLHTFLIEVEAIVNS